MSKFVIGEKVVLLKGAFANYTKSVGGESTAHLTFKSSLRDRGLEGEPYYVVSSEENMYGDIRIVSPADDPHGISVHRSCLAKFSADVFKKGDKVVLLQGAMSNGSFTGSKYDSPEGLIEILEKAEVPFDSEFLVAEELDSEGEVGICVDADEDYFYIKPEFLSLANPLEPEKVEASTIPEYKIEFNLPLDVDIEKLVKDSIRGTNHITHSQVFEGMKTVTVGKVLEAGEFLGVDSEVLEKVVKLAGRLK